MNPTPANTLIMVMAHRGEPCRELGLWLHQLVIDYAINYGSAEYSIDVARNQNCNRFLRDYPDREHLLMIDRDMVPLPATEPILTVPGDLAWCGYCGRDGSPGHYGADDFGAGCFRVSRAALEKIPKPWFRFGVSANHDLRTACECSHFRRQAAAADIVPRMVGTIGHRQDCILIPTAEGSPRVVFPSALSIAATPACEFAPAPRTADPR